jgi:aryl-alcohol dehydrogenase-like predicted oxidoreductase
MEALWVAKELGLNRFVCEQPPYHLLDRRIERELVPMAQTYGFALLPWSPLAGGFLTGKYRRGEARGQSQDARFSESNEWNDRHFNDRSFNVLERAEEIANEKGCTVSQFALAWATQQPGITSPIIGPRTMEQVLDNLGALEVVVTDEDRKRIDEVIAPGTEVVPYYQADFGPHQFRWL